jgi:hypothetical protein
MSAFAAKTRGLKPVDYKKLAELSEKTFRSAGNLSKKMSTSNTNH